MARRKKAAVEGAEGEAEGGAETVPGGEAVGNSPGEILVGDAAVPFTREDLDAGFAAIAGPELAERVRRSRAEKELAAAFRALRHERPPELGVDYDFRGSELVPKTEIAEAAIGYVRRVRRR